MMNIVALAFLLSSLVTAVVWSPEAPQTHQSMGVATLKPGDEKPKEILMREGHRVIVMEYEREGLLDSATGTANQYAKATGENVRHAASQVRHKVEEAGDEALHLLKTGADKTKDTIKATADKAKDTKDTIKSTAGKAKDTVKNTADKAKDTVKSTADKAKDTVKSTADKASDTLKGSASSALHAAGTVKDRAEDAAKDQVHRTYDKTGQVYESAKDKVSQTLDSVKDAGAGAHGEHMVGDIYGSAKDKISDVGEKIKEEGDQAFKTAGETYGSAKESVQRAGDYVQQTVEDAKESLRVKNNEEQQQQAGLKEADILYKFRQAVNEVYRLSPELLEVAGKLDRQLLPLLSTRDSKDGAKARTVNLVKDTAANLTTATGEYSKGFYNLVLSRFCRWASREALTTGLRLVHLLAFTTVYGSSMWVNFIGGHVLAKSIPRQQFGFIQSKLYPVYFNAVACGLAICLLAHSAVHPWRSPTKAERWEDYNLIFALFLTLVNMLYVEPRATKALFERLRMEKEEGRGRDFGDMNINADNLSNTTTQDLHVHSGSCMAGDDVSCKMAEVSRRLKAFHGYSSALNMLCLASLTWHLAYLSSYLKI